VQENTPASGDKRLRSSRQEAGNDAGKNIARTGGGQADIAEAAHSQTFLRLGYERSGSLQGHGGAEGLCCPTSEPLRIRLYRHPFAFEEARHFSSVRREDDLVPMRFSHSGVPDGFQGDGIEHKGPARFRLFENGLDQSIHCRVIEEAGSNQNAISVVNEP
jgi:hypothetical protein